MASPKWQSITDAQPDDNSLCWVRLQNAPGLTPPLMRWSTSAFQFSLVDASGSSIPQSAVPWYVTLSWRTAPPFKFTADTPQIGAANALYTADRALIYVLPSYCFGSLVLPSHSH